MHRILLLLLLALVGCSTGIQTIRPLVSPELISLAPLPPYRAFSFRQYLKLEFLLYISKEGTVEDAKLLSSSGDPAWDSEAVASVRQWRFTAALHDGEPTDLWIHQQVTVEFQDPVLMTLAEIRCPSEREADSLYALLDAGIDFALLARETLARTPGDGDGMLGTVDITLFTPRVRDAIRRLNEGGITRPIRVGDRYLIYKRMRKAVSVYMK